LQRRLAPGQLCIPRALWFGWQAAEVPGHRRYRDFGPVQSFGIFLGLTCGAVVLTWLYSRSGGSILLVAVWHGLDNLVAATRAAAGMLTAVVSSLIMVEGAALAGLEARAWRRGRPSVRAAVAAAGVMNGHRFHQEQLSHTVPGAVAF